MTRTDIAPGPRTSADGPTGALPRLAGWCHDHRRRVLILWIVTLVVASVISGVDRQRLPGQVRRRQRRVPAGPGPARRPLPGAGGRHGRHRVPDGDAGDGGGEPEPHHGAGAAAPGAAPRRGGAQPVRPGRREPDRRERRHRLRPGAVRPAHRGPRQGARSSRSSTPPRPCGRPASTSSSVAAPCTACTRPRSATASSSAWRRRSSSCSSPSAPWSPWACRSSRRSSASASASPSWPC